MGEIARREFLKLAAKAGLVAGAAAAGFSGLEKILKTGKAPAFIRDLLKPERPNIVLAIIDCWRYDHFTPEITPHIWKLGEEGIVFENYFVNAGWTYPSTLAFFSGKLPLFKQGLLKECKKSHGFERFGGVAKNEYGINMIPPSLPLLPALLKKEGYYTICITQNDFTSFEVGYNETHYDEIFKYGGLWDGLKIGARELSLKFEETLSKNSEKTPKFIMVHYMDSHLYYNGSNLSEEEIALQKEYRDSPSILKKLELAPLMMNYYKKGFHFIDTCFNSCFGKILSLNQEFVVILTGDHGESFGESGFFRHQHHLTEEILHVPLIIRGSFLSPQKITQLKESRLLLPTILSLKEKREKEGLLNKKSNKKIFAFSCKEEALIEEREGGEDDRPFTLARKIKDYKKSRVDKEASEKLRAMGYF